MLIKKDIQQTFRQLVRTIHPDVNPGNKEAEEKFKAINEAYQVLSTAKQRKKCNELRAQYSGKHPFRCAHRNTSPSWSVGESRDRTVVRPGIEGTRPSSLRSNPREYIPSAALRPLQNGRGR